MSGVRLKPRLVARRRLSQDRRNAALRSGYRRVDRRRGSSVEETAARSTRPPLQSLRLAVLVFIQYALLAADIRFVANAQYMGIAIVNVCIAINTWYLTRGIIEARTSVDRWCYVVGGTSGALLAVMLT